MSDTATIRMLRAYQQYTMVTMFLSGFFQSPAENFYSSEEVEIDIERDDEEIALVITDMSTGYRMNTGDIYTSKRFKPPVFKEAVPLNSFDLLNRMPGQNPFENVNFRANIITRMFSQMRKIEAKIRRAVEQQAAQVLQTGTVTLSDENGVALYTIDYKPKATHFPTAGTAWDQAGADIIGDLLALDDVIRNDGLVDPDVKLFGVDAFETAMKNEAFQKRLDLRRADLGTISPMRPNGQGGNYRGTIELGNYKSDIWTYGGRYKDPQSGAKTQYLSPEKVISLYSGARLDATFGAIPNIGALLNGGNGRLIPELPSRMSMREGGMDLFTNIWMSPNGEDLFGGIGARPLLVPTAIDQFGCIDTGL